MPSCITKWPASLCCTCRLVTRDSLSTIGRLCCRYTGAHRQAVHEELRSCEIYLTWPLRFLAALPTRHLD